jgi:hypothetical protein
MRSPCRRFFAFGDAPSGTSVGLQDINRAFYEEQAEPQRVNSASPPAIGIARAVLTA